MNEAVNYERLLLTWKNNPQCPSKHRNNDAERDEHNVVTFVCRRWSGWDAVSLRT